MLRPNLSRTRRAAVTRFSIRSRRRKAERIVRFIMERNLRSAVLTGALGSATLPNESIVERAVAQAVESVLVCDIRERPSPWPLIIADGRNMPFLDKEFDFGLANAVIEHVGDEEEQRRFVAEHARVARYWVITTPNRWFPVEPHTAVVFKHWRRAWRDGRQEFTRLLSRREFASLLPPDARIVGRSWSATFTAYSGD